MEKQSTRKFLKLIVALVAFFLIGAAALMLASCKEEHVHDFGEGVVTTNPTCTQTGVRTFTCSCGEVQYATEPVLGHDWNDPVTVDATCAKPGSITRTCARCNEVETTIIPATGAHTPSDTPDPKLSVAPTCASAGTNVYTCTVCGAVTATVTVPATGNHSWDEGVEYKASCESQGYTHYTCTVCGMTDDRDYTNKLDHYYYLEDGSLNYVNEIQATCTTAGSRQIACVRCGVRYADENYANAHPALGHKFDANTDADDTLTGIVGEGVVFSNPAIFDNSAVKYYTDVKVAKLAGWTTVTAQDCETGGLYERTCSRCGEYTETAASEATGHAPVGFNAWLAEQTDVGNQTRTQLINAYLKTQNDNGIGGVCLADSTLVDADGNAVYAYECENPNCPAKVLGADGEEHAWIAVTQDHTWGAWTTTSEPTCTTAGSRYRVCTVCGTPDTDPIPATNHVYNETQSDGKTATVQCDADEGLTLAVISNKLVEYWQGNDRKAAEVLATITANYEEGKQYAYFCLVCGELVEAVDHQMIVADLVTGMFGLNDYVKDPDTGLPIPSETASTVAEMTCRNVYVCALCGTPAFKGNHTNVNEATCREDGKCEDCGEPVYPQLQHKYIDVDTILGWENSDDATQQALYLAYTTVSANETWMKPVAATCTTNGTKVYVCETCLMDAYEGADFDWNTTTSVPTDNYTYYGYTTVTTASHEYEIVYYDLKATDPLSTDMRKVYEQTNCLFGYKVAYVCKNCNNSVYVSTDGKGTYGKTDSKGWLADENGNALDHRGDHVVYVPENYKSLNGYLASTCVEEATLPVYCVNCAQSLVYDYDEIAAVLANMAENRSEQTDVTDADEYDFVCATALPNDGVDGTDGYILSTTNLADSGLLEAEGKVNPANHASNEMYTCGEHCKAVNVEGETTYYCAALVEDGACTNETLPTGANTDAYHATIRVEIISSTANNAEGFYLDGYDLMIAFVEDADLIKVDGTATGVNWDTVELSNIDSISNCAGGAGFEGTYKLPGAYNADAPAADKYLVLVAEDGSVYPLAADNINYYTDDNTTDESSKITGDSVSLTQNDMFFVRFGTRPAVPVKAVDHESLNLAVQNAEYDEDAKAYVIEFGTNPDGTPVEMTFDWGDNSVEPAIEDTLTPFFTQLFVLAYKMPTDEHDGDAIIVDLNGAELTINSTVTHFSEGQLTDNLSALKNIKAITVKNGTLDYVAEDTKEGDYLYKYAITIPESAGDVVFDNVDISSNRGGIYVAPTSTGSLTLKNSSVTAMGAYGVYVDYAAAKAENANTSKTLITIDGSEITMARERTRKSPIFRRHSMLALPLSLM